jgi:hypothetical protein
VIDIETAHDTKDGTRLDRLRALLIGIIAILAACLATVQIVQSQAESRANAMSNRMTGDVAARLGISGSITTFQLLAMQRALGISIAGTARQIVSMTAGDPAEQAVGEAEVNAGTRLLSIAGEMGAVPDESTPIDPYVAALLRATISEARAEGDELNRQADLGDDASSRSSLAVMGLSLVALAGVLIGLSAVLGDGRAAETTLLGAYIAGAGALALLVASML